MISRLEAQERFERYLRDSGEAVRIQREESWRDDQFYHNKVGALDGIMETPDQLVMISRIKAIIDNVSGLFRQTRKEIQLQANGIEDEDTRNALSDIMTQAARDMSKAARMEYKESQQDLQMLKIGVAPIDTAISTIGDRKGKLVADVISMQDFGYDPCAVEQNMLDAEYLYYRKNYYLDTALELFPGAQESDFYLAERPGVSRSVRDRNETAYKKYHAPSKTMEKLGRVYLYTLCFRALETVRVYKNPVFNAQDKEAAIAILKALEDFRDVVQAQIDGDESYSDGYTLVFDPENKELEIEEKFSKDLEAIIGFFYGDTSYETEKRWVYYRSFHGMNKCFKVVKSINQNGHSIKVKTGYYDPESETWYGMVRQMREPDMYFKKSLTASVMIMAARSKGGIIVEETADSQELRQQWASPSGVAVVPDGYIDKVRPKQEQLQLTGYEEMIGLMSQMPMDVIGLNPSFLGMSDDKSISGVLENTRIRQVTAVLGMYADSISLYQEEFGDILVSYIAFLARINDRYTTKYSDGDGNSRMVDITKEMTDFSYTTELGSPSLSPSMKEAKFNAIRSIHDAASMIGNSDLLPILAGELDTYGVDSTTINRIILALTPKEIPPEQAAKQQAMQEQQEQLSVEAMKLSLQDARSRIRNKEADTQAKIMDTKKTLFEIDRDRAETDQIMLENAIVSSRPLDVKINL